MKIGVGIALVLVGTVLGFFLGQQQSERPQPQVACESGCEDLEKFKAQIGDLTPEQVQEYLKTQNADEKLKRADEILGKIMTAMVANIGFRLKKEDLDKFNNPPPVEKPVDTQPPPKSVRPQPVSDRPANPVAPIDRRTVDTLRGIRSEAEAAKAMEALGKDFEARYKSAGSLPPQQVDELNGRFVGRIKHFKDPGRSDLVTMEFRGRSRSDKLEGRSVISVVNSRTRANSRCRFNGDLSSRVRGLGAEVFIECNGYFELIYFPQLAQWHGNFIEVHQGNWVKVGVVTLQRMGN